MGEREREEKEPGQKPLGCVRKEKRRKVETGEDGKVRSLKRDKRG